MDNKKQSWWAAHRPSSRRLMQLYCALLYNAHVKGFIEGEIYQSKNPTTKGVCVPGFNCYSCPGAVGACPLGALQNALASQGKQAGFYVYGILMLYGLILGRTICGWLCPLGMIQELLHKIPTLKLKKNRLTRTLSYLKYIILLVFVVGITTWYGVAHGVTLPAFCKYICPAGTSEGAIFLLSNPANAEDFAVLNILFTRKFIIMLVIGLACIFCYRSFCRFLCPLGAIYGFFSRLALVGVKVDVTRCNHCGACVRSCQMDVRHVGDHECIHCAKCMDVCKQNAISLRAGSFTLKAPEAGCSDDKPESAEKRKLLRRVGFGLALAVLCFALLWYNLLDPNIQKKAMQKASAQTTQGQTEPSLEQVKEEPGQSEGASEPGPQGETILSEEKDYSSTAPLGSQVGEELEDFTIECIDGSTFHLGDYRGMPVFINQWATYCGPCVGELPYFSELYKEKEGDIAMLALHSGIVVDDPAEYLSEHGSDWVMPFAVDSEDEALWKMLGGDAMMPRTIVLNRYGEVIYNEPRSITLDMLENLYEEASKDGEETGEASSQTPEGNASEGNTSGGNASGGNASEENASSKTQPEGKESSISSKQGSVYQSDAPLGSQVGEELQDFTIECIDGSTFHLGDYRGMPVFINQWATYCGPCVGELPYFSELYKEKEGDIAMLALHSGIVVDDPAEYLTEHGSDWAMPFAVDSEDEKLWKMLGGDAMMPRTIVLNRYGEVIYNEARSMDKTMLEALYQQACQE